MAEKRKLLAEIEKCFKKIDEGVVLFEETMVKMQEANSDNQREKYQDDLKKEIKKLQRLRDQIKGWQNCSDIKDKEKLNHYRKVIEQRMEQFKDIERENKTKPHSKQGLSAEEKLDPREKEKSETIEWLQSQIRELSDESDRTETQIESLSNGENGKRRGKKDDSKKGDRDRKIEELKKHWERMNFHIGKLEICMRMVNNESLESKLVMEVLKDPVEMYVDALDPDYDRAEDELENLDPEDAYDELDLGVLSAQLGTVPLGVVEEDKNDATENGSTHESEESKGSRHGSTDAAPPVVASPASPAPRRTVTAAAVPASVIVSTTPAKASKDNSLDGAPSLPALGSSATATPPPPPGIPYNSVAAGRVAPAAAATPPPAPATLGKEKFSIPNVARQPISSAQAAAASAPPTSAASNSKSSSSPTTNDENRNPAVNESRPPAKTSNGPAPAPVAPAHVEPKAVTEPSVNGSSSRHSDVLLSSSKSGSAEVASAEETLRVLRLSQQKQQPISTEPQRAHIPAWLGASPLGRAPATQEHDIHQAALEAALGKTPLPMDSEKPRTYLPKIPCPASPYYPQNPPLNGDSLEYYLRLSPETLFFIFYYMEGTKAQLLAAKALKKLSWRFHTKYLTWFQRHEEPKQITDDFEQGTYVYFDFEKWSQRKKEAFTFEYRYLEDKDFD